VWNAPSAGQNGEMNSSEEEMKNMDLGIALSHVDGDRQLLAELAELFSQDYPRLLEEIRSSIPKIDFSALERGAHTLKGRLAFFGIHRVRDMASDLEIMGRTGNLSQAMQSLKIIEVEMERILPEFDALAREK
jgi:HPt (histidine-containing phosphotransfer) domain-containing protein